MADLSAPQHRFLALFALNDPDRIRVVWRRAGRAVDVAFAETVEAYLVGQGDGPALRGFPESRRSLRVAALDDLDRYWKVRLRTLNPEGQRAALAPAPEPTVPRCFKLAASMDRALIVRAASQQLTVSAVLIDLVNSYLEDRA